MVYLLDTFAMVSRFWKKWHYLTGFDWKLGPTGWGFAHIWLKTMSNAIPWPEGRGEVGVSIHWGITVLYSNIVVRLSRQENQFDLATA